MSEIAGSMATQEGAKYLERPQQGRGVLLGGVPGVEPGKVLILGGGVVGTAAARIAAGMGADVIIMDVNLERMRYLEDVMPQNITTIYSDPHSIQKYLPWADLLIGAVLLPGAKAPHLVHREDLARMKDGAVIVDVSIDQGGCVETSKVTTHGSPTYIIDGVVHYCVGNMPGAVSRTSTQALTNATLPWAIRLANEGPAALAEQSQGFKMAINMDRGRLLNGPVAEAHDLELAGAMA
jgi:alanine dehydrogenase